MPLRALVVEDDPVTRHLHSSTLQRAGLEVEGVADAKAALEILTRGPIHVLVLDLALQGRNGLQIAQQTRSTPATRDAVIVVVTGHDTPEVRHSADAIACDAFLRKPCRPDELLSIVLGHLRTRGFTAGAGVAPS